MGVEENLEASPLLADKARQALSFVCPRQPTPTNSSALSTKRDPIITNGGWLTLHAKMEGPVGWPHGKGHGGRPAYVCMYRQTTIGDPRWPWPQYPRPHGPASRSLPTGRLQGTQLDASSDSRDKVCLAVAREAIAGRMSRLAEGRRKGAENEQARGFRMRGKEAGPDTEPGWVNQCFHRSTKLRQRRGFRVSTAGSPPRNDWPLSAFHSTPDEEAGCPSFGQLYHAWQRPGAAG